MDISPKIEEIAQRATAAGWTVEWKDVVAPFNHEVTKRLSVSFPNGRNSRKTPISVRRAEKLANFEFEKYRFLGDFLAINASSADYIEVLIRTDRGSNQSLYDLPGVEVMQKSTRDDDLFADLDLDATASNEIAHDRPVQPDDDWRLVIQDDRRDWSAEFSPVSDGFIAMVADFSLTRHLNPSPSPSSIRPTSLKIRGLKAERHDDALRLMTNHCNAILYELEVKYGIYLELRKQRSQRIPSEGGSTNARPSPPTLPRVQYSNEALALYNYARSAIELPLLQFLAYYQVLEFFFPRHARQTAIRKLRRELLDPHFDMTSEDDLARVLSIAAVSGGSFGKENEQLQATLEGTTDNEKITEFLRGNESVLLSLRDKSRIRDVPIINIENTGQNLLDQVAARVYALRCRIVHTKSENQNSRLLLPGSQEANALGPDVLLLRFLAQKAIVAGATKL